MVLTPVVGEPGSSPGVGTTIVRALTGRVVGTSITAQVSPGTTPIVVTKVSSTLKKHTPLQDPQLFDAQQQKSLSLVLARTLGLVLLLRGGGWLYHINLLVSSLKWHMIPTLRSIKTTDVGDVLETFWNSRQVERLKYVPLPSPPSQGATYKRLKVARELYKR
jgi:hypothetical protein